MSPRALLAAAVLLLPFIAALAIAHVAPPAEAPVRVASVSSSMVPVIR